MTIASRVQNYIEDRGIAWDPIRHGPSACCMDAAHMAHVPPDRVAKAVVLEGRRNGPLMVVIRANHHVDLADLGEQLGDELALVSEHRLTGLFPDCSPGAVPPVGGAYGMRTLWDESLGGWRDVYFEAGDHRTLVHMSGFDFSTLMRGAQPIPPLH